jgi:hypothetical protein
MKYSREEALKRIREYLLANTRSDETTCQAAARLGIFCHGYDRWTVEQLRQLYPWLAKKMPPNTPKEEFLKLITAWDGARMLVHNSPTTCDAKATDHEGCLGFDRFSNPQIKRMFPQVFQPDDEITQW